MNRPHLVLTELREYRSERTGNTYFSGYLGKARVVMLRDEPERLRPDAPPGGPAVA